VRRCSGSQLIEIAEVEAAVQIDGRAAVRGDRIDPVCSTWLRFAASGEPPTIVTFATLPELN
jgi:hypothetical protein